MPTLKPSSIWDMPTYKSSPYRLSGGMGRISAALRDGAIIPEHDEGQALRYRDGSPGQRKATPPEAEKPAQELPGTATAQTNDDWGTW